MSQRTDFLSHSPFRSTASDRFNTVLRRIGGIWKALMHRRAINRLAELDDTALADLGLTRTDVSLALGLPLHEDPSTKLRIWALERRSARLQMQRLSRYEAHERAANSSMIKAPRAKERCC